MDTEIKEIVQERKKFIGSLTSNHFLIYLSIYMFLINWKHLGFLIFGAGTVDCRIETFSSRYYGSKFMFWEYSFWENGWVVLLLCGVLAWLSWKFLPDLNNRIKEHTGEKQRELLRSNDQETAIEKWIVENPKDEAIEKLSLEYDQKYRDVREARNIAIKELKENHKSEIDLLSRKYKNYEELAPLIEEVIKECWAKNEGKKWESNKVKELGQKLSRMEDKKIRCPVNDSGYEWIFGNAAYE